MRNHSLVGSVIAAGIVLTAPASASQYPSADRTPSATRIQREHELAVVQDTRRLLADPRDGLSLWADLQELRRLHGTGAASSAARPSSSPAGSVDIDQLLDDLSAVVAIWHSRLGEQTGFLYIRREHVDAFGRADQSLSRLATRFTVLDQPFILGWRAEIEALKRYMRGQGEVPDIMVGQALSIAEAAGAGRPVVGGRYGPGAPTRPTFPSGGPYPQSSPQRPAPGGGGSAPLPPVYGAYGAGGAAAMSLSCLRERQQAASSSDSAGMLRVADCWSRETSYPGAAWQTIDALEWALTYAAIARSCADIDAVVQRTRSVRGLPPGYPDDLRRVTDLPRRAEEEKARLRSQGLCR